MPSHCPRYDRANSRARGGHMTSGFRLIAVLAALFGACLSRPLAAADEDLAHVYRIIASKRFVDLTHSFDPRSPVWSGFGQAKMRPAADPKTQRPYTIKEDGFRTTLYEFVGQYGTHVDPPAHFDEKGITMDVIPLKQMILPLVVLDATPYLRKDPNHAFSLDDLHAREKKHGRIPRSEEHTSELQPHVNLVCRLLLEKKHTPPLLNI